VFSGPRNLPLQDFDSSVPAEARHEFHPPSRKGYSESVREQAGAPGEPARIDSTVIKFVTIRVIRVSKSSGVLKHFQELRPEFPGMGSEQQKTTN